MIGELHIQVQGDFAILSLSAETGHGKRSFEIAKLPLTVGEMKKYGKSEAALKAVSFFLGQSSSPPLKYDYGYPGK